MNRSVSIAVPRTEHRSGPDITALGRWMVAFCAIRFDLEQGQVVEECYPAGSISSEEEYDVAFSSFPDSVSQTPNRSSVHDCMFFFRIRRRGAHSVESQKAPARRTISLVMPEDRSGSSLLTELSEMSIGEGKFEDKESLHRRSSSEDEQPVGEGWRSLRIPNILATVLSPAARMRSIEGMNQVAPGTQRNTAGSFRMAGRKGGPGSGGPRYLYGFVFNRQRKDERLKRGGEQRSVVILSESPYSSVFRSLLQILGPLYFDIGSQALEQFATYVCRWPNPMHGGTMELSVGNVILRTHLPPAHTLPPGCGTPMDDFTSAMAPAANFNPSVPQGVFHESDIFGIFRGLLMQLWVLWELVLIGEPLLIVAPTPSQCCEAVAALLGLVAPLPCSVDFRPYFTIHDPDFSTLNSLKEGEQPPPMILGVTNLFFLKSLRNLPHVISVGPSVAIANRLRLASRASSPNRGDGEQGLMQLRLSPLKKLSPTNLLKVARIRRDGPLCLMTEHREALWTTYVSTTKPDTAVLNRLVDAGFSPRIEESMSVVNNEILRRHFLELTTNFLAPFGPYLRATTPQEGASPFVDPPPLTPFDAHGFLEGLAARGPGKFLSKRLSTNWLDLYRRFLRGPNFMPWFQRRRAVAEHEQHRIWRQARAKADVHAFLANMSELEVIDSFNAVERHLLLEMEAVQRAGLGSIDSPVCKKLRGDLRTIYSSLRKDMQQLLLLNPQRAELLTDSQEVMKLPGRPSIQTAKGESQASSIQLIEKSSKSGVECELVAFKER